jgi:hypothetical protein
MCGGFMKENAIFGAGVKGGDPTDECRDSRP